MRMLLNRDDEMVHKNKNTASFGSAAGSQGMAALPRRPTGLKDEKVKAGSSRRSLTGKDDEVKKSALRRSSMVSVGAVVRRVGRWRWMESGRAGRSKRV